LGFPVQTKGFDMTPTDLFDPKTVCTALAKRGVISRDKAKGILTKQSTIRLKLEKQTAKKQKDGLADANSVTIVDVIASMKLGREDGQPGFLDEDAVFEVLAREWDLPYRKIDPLKLDLNLVTTTIPRNFAMKHLVLPIDIKDGHVTVASPSPPNLDVLDDITRVTNLKVDIIISSKTDIIKLIKEFFGFKRSIAAAEDMFAGPSVEIGNLEQYVRLKSTDEIQSTDHHVVNAVNHILLYAFDQRASDIHIEPKREEVMVRMRIDGVLHTVYKLPKKVHNPMISRIKTLSRLNIAEKRRPQDGRIKTDKGGAEPL
jgi:general secretion pathway protein E